VAIGLQVPSQLKVSTDIVGYPIHQAFNANRLTDLYYLLVLFFPISSLLLYLGLTWLAVRLGLVDPAADRPITPQVAVMPESRQAEKQIDAPGLARILAVGAVFGLEAGIIVDGGRRFWLVAVGTVVGYGTLVLAGALAIRRRSGGLLTLEEMQARLNAQAAPLALLGLLGVSAVTRVTVASNRSVHQYAWFPWWLAVTATAAVGGWLWWRLSHAKTEQAARSIERRTLLFLTAPVALFLLLSGLPGDLGTMDVFHEGERLTAAHLTSRGWFPWRDLMSTHGPLEDNLVPLLGMRLFGYSRWGHAAASALFLNPLFFVFLYLFAAWMFERNWAFVLTFGVMVLGSQLIPGVPDRSDLPLHPIRYIFWPLILLLFGATLHRRRWWLGALLGAGLLAQAVLVPDMGYLVPACGIVLLLYELKRREPGVGLAATFPRTVSCIAAVAATALVFGAFLFTHNALGKFIFYYAIFARGLALTGAQPLPLDNWDARFAFVAIAPLVALLLGFWYYAASAIQRRPLDTMDWVMAAAAIFTLLFYSRTLARADFGHAVLSNTVALPLMAFLVFRATTFLDRAFGRIRWARRFGALSARPVSIALLGTAVVSISGPLPARLAETPHHYRPVVAAEPQISRLGYSDQGFDRATYADLAMVLQAYLRPGDWVFDFSNEPGLYYYLLDLAPRTRYYHISMAIPEAAQKDLINQLKRDPPKLIVFNNDRLGLPVWDGIPNMVRHYDVSQYVLDNYRPLLSTHTQILYAQASANLSAARAVSLPLSESVLTGDLYFRVPACNWGYAPNFLSISPPAPVHSVTPTTLTGQESAGGITVSGWAADPETGSPVRQVVVTTGGEVLGSATPKIDRPDVATALRSPGYSASGYGLRIPMSSASAGDELHSVRVFGISARGIASELGYGRDANQDAATLDPARVSQIRLGNGTLAPVRPGAVIGYVDQISFSTDYQLVLSPPAGVTWAGYRWLEITTNTSFREDGWSLSDGPSTDLHREVTFRTLASSAARYRVYVGSCSQWHGYGPGKLYLTHGVQQDIAAVRLLP